MRGAAHHLILVGVIVSAASPLCGAPRQSLREFVRQHGDTTQYLQGFFPPRLGIKDIVEQSSLTIEGVVSRVETSLTPDEVNIYTDVVIDVTRVFRMALQAEIAARPGPSSIPSPFVPEGGVAGPGAATAQVRLRLMHTGTIQLDGGTATQRGEYPTLHVGEHIVTSAALDPLLKAPGSWVPVGIFYVRDDGQVVGATRPFLALHYDSVEAFAAALANPAADR